MSYYYYIGFNNTYSPNNTYLDMKLLPVAPLNLNTITLMNYNSSTIIGSNTIFAYTTASTFTNSILINGAKNLNLQIFAVGGGGSGGCDQSGGGGAGGLLQKSYTINGSETISLTIGAGGIALGSPNLSVTGGNTSVTFTTNTANSITCYGGGGGGSYVYGPNLNSSGTAVTNCGSGGGASSFTTTVGSGTAGQGNNGGASGSGSSGVNGGGGGAGAVGGSGSGSTSGNGGDGLQINTSLLPYFAGTNYANYWWAGGGGGAGSLNGCYPGKGGKGGGGGGSSNSYTGGLGDTSGISNATNGGQGGNQKGGNAGANTGGGGGGASQGGGDLGGDGGSGIILVAVPTISVSQTYYFSYTGADQSITIPASATTVTIKCWGAGGGNAGTGNVTTYKGWGGAGGYTAASFNIVSYRGTSLKIIVGQGGLTVNQAQAGATYGGGGASGGSDGNWGSSSGGGRSAVQLSISGTYTEIITAGGGGGGGHESVNSSYASTGYGSGGAGGGLVAGNARDAPLGGYGGTTTGYNSGTGGAGAVAGNTNGSAGGQFTGGTGGSYGMGGGGGYYGGGGGGLNSSLLGQWVFTGGGGGSSFVYTASPVNGTQIAMQIGNDWSTTTYGNKALVANDSGLPTGYTGGLYGYGAPAAGTGSAGGNGFVIVSFT